MEGNEISLYHILLKLRTTDMILYNGDDHRHSDGIGMNWIGKVEMILQIYNNHAAAQFCNVIVVSWYDRTEFIVSSMKSMSLFAIHNNM